MGDGGFRSSSESWTGNRPRPVKHIPWPEIFKHHISNIEGHLKMLDMVKKHTVPNTGNWRTIVPMVERTQEMLRAAKDVTRTFVPPPNEIEKDPLSSSSTSRYPEHLPADHRYGKEAQEFGSAWSAAKSQSVRGQGSGSRSGPEAPVADAKMSEASANGDADETTRGNLNEDGNPYFVVDTNPTPVNFPGISPPSTKRDSQTRSPLEPVGKRSKRRKTKHDEASSDGMKENRVELEDISGEVDARLKEKEEKRRQKKGKKRKRISEEASSADAKAVESLIIPERPKKKKKKSKKAEGEAVAAAAGAESVKRRGSNGEEHANDGTKKKRLKKSKEGNLDSTIE